MEIGINQKAVIVQGYISKSSRELIETMTLGSLYNIFSESVQSMSKPNIDSGRNIRLYGRGLDFRSLTNLKGVKGIIPKVISRSGQPVTLRGENGTGPRSISGLCKVGNTELNTVLGENGTGLRGKNGTGPRSETGSCVNGVDTLRGKNGTGPRSETGSCVNGVDGLTDKYELDINDIREKRNTDRENLFIKISYTVNTAEAIIRKMAREGEFNNLTIPQTISKIEKVVGPIINASVNTALDAIEEVKSDDIEPGGDDDISKQSVSNFVGTVVNNMKEKYEKEKEEDTSISNKIKDDDTDNIPVDEDDDTDVEGTKDKEKDTDEDDDTLADMNESMSMFDVPFKINTDTTDNVLSCVGLMEDIFVKFSDNIDHMGESIDDGILYKSMQETMSDIIASGKILYNIGLVARPSVFFNSIKTI